MTRQYDIVPTGTVFDHVISTDAEQALMDFVDTMDTDMSSYFKAVEEDCAKNMVRYCRNTACRYQRDKHCTCKDQIIISADGRCENIETG